MSIYFSLWPRVPYLSLCQGRHGKQQEPGCLAAELRKQRWLLILSLHSPFIQTGSQAMEWYHTFLVDLPISVNLIRMGPEAYLIHDSTSYDTDINCCECALY